MNVRYEKQDEAIASRHNEIKEEVKAFLRKPRTQKEIMKRFNWGKEQFKTWLVHASMYWPIWEEFGYPKKYGWLM